MESSEPAVAQPSKDEINWAALAHVLSLIGAVLPVIGNILPPLIIDEGPVAEAVAIIDKVAAHWGEAGSDGS